MECGSAICPADLDGNGALGIGEVDMVTGPTDYDRYIQTLSDPPVIPTAE